MEFPTAHIEGIRDGKFTSWTVDEYCAFGKGKPADDESSRVRTIDSINVSGNAGIVRATLVYGNVTFTDYFVLLLVDGEWKIANKVYYRHGSTLSREVSWRNQVNELECSDATVA